MCRCSLSRHSLIIKESAAATVAYRDDTSRGISSELADFAELAKRPDLARVFAIRLSELRLDAAKRFSARVSKVALDSAEAARLNNDA